MKKYLYLIKNAKIPTYLKYWLMYSSKKISLLIQSLPITLDNTIKDLKITINKIYGNTEQATRSGKNKFKLTDKAETLSGASYVAQNGVITINNECTQNFSTIAGKAYLEANKTYAISLNNNKDLNTSYFYFEKSGGTIIYIEGNKTVSISDTGEYTLYFVIKRGTYDNLVIKPQFEEGTSYTAFEQFGASPSPDYPSPVNNITGDVEITISNEDNTQEQNYPISLGDIELCKIGEYQDYIYKENDNWYKYSAIGKVVLDGTETGQEYSNKDTENYYCYWLNAPDDIIVSQNVLNLLKCNYFKESTWNDIYSKSHDTPVIALRDNKRLYFRSGENTFSNFQAWLSTHNTIVYYVLATPTTTQITDTTLINQLNALEEAYSYEDVTNISSNQNIYLDIDYIKRG